MKAIRIMICIVLSLALAMAGAYAEPVLDGGVTLRNVVISLNGEEIALNQQARVLANADEDGAALRFEVINGEKVLLPLAGEIDANGVRFTLDDSGRVYSMDMNMIMESLDIDQEIMEILQLAAEYIETAVSASAALADPANAEAVNALVDTMWAALTGNPGQQSEIEIGGAKYPAVTYQGPLTFNHAIAELDAAANSGIAEWDKLMADFLQIFAMALETEVTSFADLKAMMLEEGMTEEDCNMEMGTLEMTVGGDDTAAAMRGAITIANPDGGEDVVITLEETATADAITMNMGMEAGDDENAINASAACSMAVSEGEVVSADGSVAFDFGYNYNYDGYTDAMATVAGCTYKANKADGLWTSSTDISFKNEITYGYEDDLTTVPTEGSASFTCNETLEADGSVTSAVALKAAIPDGEYGLSFEVNRADASGLTALAGENADVYALTDDEEAVAYTLLQADAMGLFADVMELAADEQLAKLAAIFSEMSGTYDDYYSEDEYYTDEYAYTEEGVSGDQVAEEIQYSTVYSYEEAAAIYTGAMPSYAAPQGYALSYIDVSPTDMYVEYAGADESYLAFYLLNTGEDLSYLGSEVAYYEDDEGSYVGAEFVKGSSYVMFYFDSVDQAAADAIMAGFSL